MKSNRLTIDRALVQNLDRIYRRLHEVFDHPVPGDAVQMTPEEHKQGSDGLVFFGICDWGGCEQSALAWRYDTHGHWLPVCRACMAIPEPAGRIIGVHRKYEREPGVDKSS